MTVGCICVSATSLPDFHVHDDFSFFCLSGTARFATARQMLLVARKGGVNRGQVQLGGQVKPPLCVNVAPVAKLTASLARRAPPRPSRLASPVAADRPLRGVSRRRDIRALGMQVRNGPA